MQKDVSAKLKLTGTVVPVASVDVKSQATSVVSAVHLREGQFVRKGDLLFTLDSRADQANVAKAQAQLAKDQASYADAQRQLERSKQLYSQNFISQGAVDTAQAQVDAQKAVVQSDLAAIEAARVTLSYGRITAPSAGRVGVINVFPGSAVQANQTTLVTITQLDPINVAFAVPQRNLDDALAALKAGNTSVGATLPDGEGNFKGKLQFVDSLIDPGSGTVRVKAQFANKESKLWPGSFVDIHLDVNPIKGAIVIPLASVVQTTRGNMAYVIEQGKAVQKPVQILMPIGDAAAVSGVKAGELVIVEGKQNVRPGSSVIDRAASAPGDGAGLRKPKPAASAVGGEGSKS